MLFLFFQVETAIPTEGEGHRLSSIVRKMDVVPLSTLRVSVRSTTLGALERSRDGESPLPSSKSYWLIWTCEAVASTSLLGSIPNSHV